MDCSTCINIHNPFKGGYCRVMTEEPSDKRCYTTKRKAIAAERQIIRYSGEQRNKKDAESQIAWLEKLEG